MKYIDLFAGVGGFRYGIEKATKAECVYSSEWDKYANSVYRRHFGECDSRDIRTVTAESIPDFDLLCGGFPCQAFSVAGRRRGFLDTRGTLFFEIARIVRAKRPRLLLLENVKGLLSHDKGATFQVILTALDELGYDCQWQVLNSKDFGVPQNRERVFIIGHLRGTPRPKVFPLGESNSAIATIRNETGKEYIRDSKGPDGRPAKRRDISYAIGAYYYKGVNSGSSGGKNSFDKKRRQTVGEFPKIRRLTPIECERLQGFPDNWTAIGIEKCDGSCVKDLNGGFDLRKCGGHEIKISDSQRYKMMGNAVTTTVITAIAEKLL